MKIIDFIAKYMGYGSTVALFFLMGLTVVHVFGRSLHLFSVKGSIELSSYMLLMLVALGWCNAALEERHIKVDLLLVRLSKKAQFIIINAGLIVSSIMLAWATWANGVRAMGGPRYSSVLEISDIPFRWVLTVGLGMFCLCTLVVIIRNFRKRGKDGN